MLGFQPLQEQSSLCFFVCSADAIYSLTAVFAFHQMLWKLEKKMFHRRRVLWVHGWFEAIGHLWCLAGQAKHYNDVEGFSVELLNLEADLMHQVRDFLSQVPKLSSLTFRQCGLSGHTASCLQVLGMEPTIPDTFQNLIHLDLSMNVLSLEGAHFLAEVMPAFPKLQTLLLDGNGLGPAGLAALVPSLSQLPLSTLDLSLNGWEPLEWRPWSLHVWSFSRWISGEIGLVPAMQRSLAELLQSMSSTLVRLDISKLGFDWSVCRWFWLWSWSWSWLLLLLLLLFLPTPRSRAFFHTYSPMEIWCLCAFCTLGAGFRACGGGGCFSAHVGLLRYILYTCHKPNVTVFKVLRNGLLRYIL